MNAEQYALRFKTQSPIRLYYGPSLLKPAVLDLIARHFDGVILQTLYGIADMEASLARLQAARTQSPLGEPLRKVMLLNASVSRDGEAARQHAKRFVSHIVSGWPDEVLEAKGIDPQAIQAVRKAYAENRGVDYAAALTPDEAVDRLIIAGTPAQCSDADRRTIFTGGPRWIHADYARRSPRSRYSRSDRSLGQRNPSGVALILLRANRSFARRNRTDRVAVQSFGALLVTVDGSRSLRAYAAKIGTMRQRAADRIGNHRSRSASSDWPSRAIGIVAG